MSSPEQHSLQLNAELVRRELAWRGWRRHRFAGAPRTSKRVARGERVEAEAKHAAHVARRGKAAEEENETQELRVVRVRAEPERAQDMEPQMVPKPG